MKEKWMLMMQYNVSRTTASIINTTPLGGSNRYIASSLVWGYNNGHTNESSVLVETNVQLDRFALYGRYEWVQKGAGELALEDQFGHDQLFNINALTAGANYVVLRKYNTNMAIGAQLTLYSARELESVYGKNPVAAEVYVRLYPHLMKM